MAGLDVPTDSADAAEMREAERTAEHEVRPLRRRRRSRRGELDASAVLAAAAVLVDSHPLGPVARAQAASAIWPWTASPPLGRRIEIEDAALDLLADPAWIYAHAEESARA